MRALLDVNVLIALLDSDHASHSRATQWFADHAKEGWASCPITQNGCLRIMSHPRYPNALTVQAIAQRLIEATNSKWHEFWPDSVSLLDPRVANTTRIHGPRQITDIYLLALAVSHQARFVTFDASIAHSAVAGSQADQLLVL